MIFLCVICIFIKAERGYIYSVDENKFLTYDRDGVGLIHLVYKDMPRAFSIEEQKNNLLIRLIDSTASNHVLDSSRSKNEIIGYAQHGNPNQLFKMLKVPKSMIKLEVDGKCVSTEAAKRYLFEDECDNRNTKPGQYFMWIKENRRRDVEDFVDENRRTRKSRRGDHNYPKERHDDRRERNPPTEIRDDRKDYNPPTEIREDRKEHNPPEDHNNTESEPRVNFRNDFGGNDYPYKENNRRKKSYSESRIDQESSSHELPPKKPYQGINTTSMFNLDTFCR